MRHDLTNLTCRSRGWGLLMILRYVLKNGNKWDWDWVNRSTRVISGTMVHEAAGYLFSTGDLVLSKIFDHRRYEDILVKNVDGRITCQSHFKGWLSHNNGFGKLYATWNLFWCRFFPYLSICFWEGLQSPISFVELDHRLWCCECIACASIQRREMFILRAKTPLSLSITWKYRTSVIYKDARRNVSNLSVLKAED